MAGPEGLQKDQAGARSCCSEAWVVQVFSASEQENHQQTVYGEYRDQGLAKVPASTVTAALFCQPGGLAAIQRLQGP